MNPFLLLAFLVMGSTANSYGSSANSPIRIVYGNQPILAPSSYYRHSSSTPSYYSQHGSSSPSTFSHHAASSAFPASSSTSNYSPSSPTAYSSSPSPYGYASRERNAAIVSFNRNIRPSNSDTTSFTTSNGISSSHNVHVVRGRPSYYRDEYGQMVQSDTTIAMNGHSYHQSPEGMHVSLTWNADENGFSAQGDHLPQPVLLPAEHAEAHRQAIHVAAQPSSSGGYGSGSSDFSGGYGSLRSTSSNYGPPPQTQAVPYQSYSAPQQQTSYRPSSSPSQPMHY